MNTGCMYSATLQKDPDREPEGERHAEQPDPDPAKGRRHHGVAAAREGEPEEAGRFGGAFADVYGKLLRSHDAVTGATSIEAPIKAGSP
jgi:hypothetical protein